MAVNEVLKGNTVLIKSWKTFLFLSIRTFLIAYAFKL